MPRYVLLFKGECGRCSKLAAQVVTASEGALEAVALSTPLATRWASEAGLGLPGRPALVILSGGRTELLTGLRMTSRLVRLLGPRRSVAVLRAIGEDHAGSGAGRRAFLRSGLIGLGVVAGTAVLPGIAQAQPKPVGFSVEETTAALRKAADYNRMDIVHKRLLEHGFRPAPYQEIVTGAREEPVVVSFYQRKDNDPTQAAVLTRRANDRTAGSLELFSANPAALVNGEQVDLTQVQHTPVSLARPGEVQPLSPSAYFYCMLACVGPDCAGAMWGCRMIPMLPAMLACIATFCYGPAYNCHGQCDQHW
jgi:hypothetical protein